MPDRTADITRSGRQTFQFKMPGKPFYRGASAARLDETMKWTSSCLLDEMFVHLMKFLGRDLDDLAVIAHQAVDLALDVRRLRVHACGDAF